MDLKALLDAHTPSLTDADEERIVSIMFDADVADLALRTCSCGVTIYGYYAYVDHLLEVAK